MTCMIPCLNNIVFTSGIDDDEPVTLREITTTALYAESRYAQDW